MASMPFRICNGMPRCGLEILILLNRSINDLKTHLNVISELKTFNIPLFFVLLELNENHQIETDSVIYCKFIQVFLSSLLFYIFWQSKTVSWPNEIEQNWVSFTQTT